MSDVEERREKIRQQRKRARLQAQANAEGKRWSEALGPLQSRVREYPPDRDSPDAFEHLLERYSDPLNAVTFDSVDRAALGYPGRTAAAAAIESWGNSMRAAQRELLEASPDIPERRREALVLLAEDVHAAGIALAAFQSTRRHAPERAARWLAAAAYRLGACEERIRDIRPGAGRKRKADRSRVRARFAELREQDPNGVVTGLYLDVGREFDIDADTVRKYVGPSKPKRPNGSPPEK